MQSRKKTDRSLQIELQKQFGLIPSQGLLLLEPRIRPVKDR